MEFSPNVTFPFRRAEIPKGDAVLAELLGVDDGSYFHVAFSDPSIDVMYQDLVEKMQGCIRGRHCMPIRLITEGAVDCIVEYPGRRGGVYVRGKILESLPETENVRCELVDDALDVVVHQSQIFHTNPIVVDYPKFSLKCKLADMDIFLNSPFLKLLYQEYMKGEWKPGSSQCIVKVLEKEDPIPTVKLTTAVGMDLGNVLQQYISTFQRLEYPQLGIPTRVNITHCDEKGQVWFQPWKNTVLYAAVKSRLHQYSDGYLMLRCDVTSQGTSWKDYYLKGPGEIFIFKEGRKSCRVRKLSKNVDGSVEIFFVDHGYCEIVRDDRRLLPAKLVDPNLCFIPPQCLPVRFIGAACSDDGINGFNVRKFWKYAHRQPVCIVLKECDDSTDIPDISHKDQLVSSHCVDVNHNFLPPPPTATNKPVSLGIETVGIQLDQKGTLHGGVIPPQADILVNLYPDANCLNQTVGHSLYDIFHTLEVCHAHALMSPTVHWSGNGINPQNELASYGNESDTERRMETSSRSSISASSPESLDEDAPNWVEYAMKADRLGLSGVSRSLSPSSDASSSPKMVYVDRSNNWQTRQPLVFRVYQIE